MLLLLLDDVGDVDNDDDATIPFQMYNLKPSECFVLLVLVG